MERVIHTLHEAHGLFNSMAHVITHRDVHHVRATLLCVLLAFIGYNVISALNRRLGERELYKLFFVTDKVESDGLG